MFNVKGLTAAMGAMWEVSAQSKEETVIVKDMMKSYVTANPVKSQWHEQFLDGRHEQMGDCVVQDEAILIEQMVALMDVFEENYKQGMRDSNWTPNQVREVLFPALFSILAFCGAL
jgi:hypothetical protein